MSSIVWLIYHQGCQPVCLVLVTRGVLGMETERIANMFKMFNLFLVATDPLGGV